MEQLIPVINKLQDVFNAVGGESIDLPQIVVIGSQSSGKSSVLENIVGRDFLPRGSGIVTRRPLILQLINIPPDSKASPKFQEWGEFLHKPNEMFYDFEKIRAEIDAETERIAGQSKGVSPNPIRLRIYSPNVLNLTLVDLPGMTKLAVAGQPADIEAQIRRMIAGYISKPNAIILAVTAANTDMANSDGLQLSKEYDPEGKRTIGVVTKIDIMDRGTDALDMLLGRVIPLKMGFVGVVNRSQQDINNKTPIRQSLKNEADFFGQHALYRSIAGRCGTAYLSKMLNKILLNHIRNALPDLKMKINSMIADAETEMATYGDPMFNNPKSQGALLLQIITKFVNDYRDSIDGKSGQLSVHELYGGARIHYIFSEIYTKCLSGIHTNDALTLNDIRTAIKNATGPRASLFVPEESFELLVRNQISRLEEPSLQCVELVYDELQRIISQLESKELQRFQVLRERVIEVVNNMLHQCKIPTRKMITNLISIENAYINTSHGDFVGGGGAISSMFEKMARQQHQPQQQQQLPAQPQHPQHGGAPHPQHPQHPSQPQQGGMPQGGAQGAPGQPGGPNSGFFNKFFGGKDQPGGGGAQPQQPGGPPQRQAPQPGYGQPPAMSAMHSQYGVPAQRSDRLDQMPMTIKAALPSNDKERFETELIQNLLSSYFDIVRKNISDTVPKAIMHFLVNTSKEEIQHELVRHLYKEDLLGELLEESPVIASRRKACQAMLDVLRKANEVLMEVRDFNPNRF